jgi:hypothetical protein
MTVLHLGCGNRKISGMVNVDFRKTSATDVVSDMRNLGQWATGSIDRIETYHAIEHVAAQDIPPMLRGWLRVLKPGAKLVIECPDIAKNMEECQRRNFAGDCLVLIFGMYRPEPGGMHVWGWTRHTLALALTEAGFVNIKQMAAQDYHTQYEGLDCLRVEAEKKR